MENSNLTSGFILMGFSDLPYLQISLITALFLMYFFTLLGNLLIIIVVCSDPCLYNPMYFLLGNLSFVDMTYTTVTIPKTLVTYFTGSKTISFIGCLMQLFFFVSFASTEFLLLTAMAYDRYVAICNPFHYTLIMNRTVCFLLSATSWVLGVRDSAFSVLVSMFKFCKSNVINHFFCDLRALLTLTCSDTSNIELVIFVECLLIGMGSFLLTLFSYVRIVNALLKIKSTQGRQKAFSTCTSHLTSVTLFFGTMMLVYVRPASVSSLIYDKLFAMLYVALIPTLNPLIYSLRNKDVKRSLKKLICSSKNRLI